MSKKAGKNIVANENLTSLLTVDGIRSVFELMNEHGIGELQLEHGETHIKIVGKQQNQQPQTVLVSQPQVTPFPAMTPMASRQIPEEAFDSEPEIPPSAKSANRVIRAPMVGTFYGRPSPDVAAFVDPGDAVQPETVVCLIEAMKLFNEIKAETTGVIVKTLVKDGSPVEFNQPLFEIKD